MIEKVIEFSIRNRFVVLASTAALAVAGVFALVDTPIDAIPDLSENQAIVFADWMGRSPREIEDQVTYPLSLKLQGLAGVRAVRSSSEFNFSMITIIFNDGVDFYFARQRVSEKLAQAAAFLPAGVTPVLAPDATALGQIFWYTVEAGAEHEIDPPRLWALNKFYIAPQLNAAAGVADVAIVGGSPLEYQIDVRPEALRANGLTLGELHAAVARSNMPAGGGVIQKNNAEYIVRGVGWIRGKQDIEDTVIRAAAGAPICVKNVARVSLGVQFRRSVLEKDGSEVPGGVVLMRHGENPRAVTERVKRKIFDLQAGLPAGVHIVPAYDRTRLIDGAIHTLSDVMTHEMIIASLAILLILMHVRSVFVICVTLPLSVLFSFLLMAILRRLGILDVQANIMSLAGITISIGVLVDQAIVMTENATHHLKRHFGDRPVTGDIRPLVLGPCKTVGRPIFFSVMIMLLSFVPVFMLGGREGKYFQPLAFTKSFAMIGVALISITVVPALIPGFVRGRLRSEEENPIVRGFIHIYKPLLTWALPRRNLVMWAFAALLLLAAGMFPLQALFGMGANTQAWRTAFLLTFALVAAVTVIATSGLKWQLLSFASLVCVALWSYHFPKIGVSFMPALEEGVIMDMPSSVPRAGVTEVVDDLKARDALLRGFPEVESVIGKAGRADTATDPAPLEMVETFVNFRPRELWPKRTLRFADAQRQTAAALDALESQGFAQRGEKDARDDLLNTAAQAAITRFDEIMRSLALDRYRELERELGPALTRHAVQEAIVRMERNAAIAWPGDKTRDREEGESRQGEIDRLVAELLPAFGVWLAKNPSLEDVDRLSRRVAGELHRRGAVADVVAALSPAPAARSWRESAGDWAHGAAELFGSEPRSFAGDLLASIEGERTRAWRQKIREINWELHDRGAELFTWLALEELAGGLVAARLLADAPRGADARALAAASIQSQFGKPADAAAYEPFVPLYDELRGPFAARVFLWPRQPGKDGDLVDDEMDRRVMRVPGWSNVFTRPIQNRVDMLSTGVRTDIGVKVFGPDLASVERVSKEVEAALKPLDGASDVVAALINNKGYLQIDIDRDRAARYGVAVEDVQNEIEVALAGRAVTQTVEQRDRFPARVRYSRASREDEVAVGRLLIPTAGRNRSGGAMGRQVESRSSQDGAAHGVEPGHDLLAGLIPLSAVADVKIVEGPATIKSEGGRLLNYVMLNVRGRDMVGFVDEARRVVAEKVKLPAGVHLEWSGEFEHQARAARTLRFVFPAVLMVIFIILYLTYNDLWDALLMMMAAPEAMAGGAFFMFLFPKLRSGWDAPPMDFSVAAWVGFIACFGMAAETGVIMLVYLREAIDKRGGLENIASLAKLREAVVEGAAHRLRPKLLTEGVAIIAIFPMVFASGVGGEILAPMALPVLGGLLISDEVVDLFLPVRFYWVRRARWLKLHGEKSDPAALPACPAGAIVRQLGSARKF